MAEFVFMMAMAVFGLSYLIRGEFWITKTRRVDAQTGKFLGTILLTAVAIDLVTDETIHASIVAMVLVIMIGFSKAERVSRDKKSHLRAASDVKTQPRNVSSSNSKEN